MRSLFLLLLLANLVCFAVQFDVVRDVWRQPMQPDRPAQVNAERLRLIRDTSARPTGSSPAPTREPLSRSGE